MLISNANALLRRRARGPACASRSRARRGGCARRPAPSSARRRRAALATIERHGPLTPSELADARAHPAADGDARVARLEEAGLVDRTAGPGDGPLVPGRGDRRRAARCCDALRTRKNAYLARRLGRSTPDERATLDRAAAMLERLLEEEARDGRSRRTVRLARVPNYRRYFAGQLVSLSRQLDADRRRDVADPAAHRQRRAGRRHRGLQFLPILLFGAWGGLLADRLAKRRLLMVTQALMALPALALWALTAQRHRSTLWMVYALVFARGARQRDRQPGAAGFVIELVGPDRVVNAVALNSVIVHTRADHRPGRGRRADRARRRRPLLRGQRALVRRDARRAAGMDPARAAHAGAARRAPRPAARGAALRARARRTLRIPLAMMAVVGTLSLQLPGPAAAARQLHLARHGGDLRAADDRDGRRLGDRRAGRRRARARLPALLVGAATAFGVARAAARRRRRCRCSCSRWSRSAPSA